MKLPILYALAYPNRLQTNFPRFNFAQYPQLSFEQPDLETFGCLKLAIEAMKMGGIAPCVLNAANEIAVEAFLQKRISFLGIEQLVDQCLQAIPNRTPQNLEDFVEADRQTRNFARTLIV
jgi:1-deoxy-D-xylulose-5-phosphate reductoisomerase